jgi:hypothetical protein
LQSGLHLNHVCSVVIVDRSQETTTLFKALKTHAKAIAYCAGIPALILGAGGVANASTINCSVLYNFNTDNQCLAVASGSINNGAGVIQWDCTNGTEQLWSFDYLATKTFNGST